MNELTKDPVEVVSPTSLRQSGKFLGRGRSATVYAVDGPSGPVAARKVFVGSTLADIVHRFFYGADNPYKWCRESIVEAHHRREVLGILVRWWLPGKLRVAQSHGTGWNDELEVNEMTMDFVDGPGARLWNPMRAADENELAELIGEVMKPLQGHLIEAGFNGAAWQAGYFNPVATSNFLRETAPDGNKEWIWIDIESGVPALFSANPYGLLSFYLPHSLRLRRALFDDVDVAKFQRYLDTHREAIERELGDGAWKSLQSAAGELEQPGNPWRNFGWVRRGIEARLRRSEISPEEADWYRKRPLRWFVRESRWAARKTMGWLRKYVFRRLEFTVLARFALELVRLVISDQKRIIFARQFIGRAIDKWTRRKQLEPAEREQLQNDLHVSESSVYLTDFGMHLAIKPFVKFLVWFVIPVMYGVGLANESVVVIAAAAGGAIGRTLYTGYRIVSGPANRRSRPWVALLVGFFPVVGNAAFPAQVMFDGAQRGDVIARFIICHFLTRLGLLVPIWGGEDTVVEHRFNRIARFLLSRFPARKETPAEPDLPVARTNQAGADDRSDAA